MASELLNQINAVFIEQKFTSLEEYINFALTGSNLDKWQFIIQALVIVDNLKSYQLFLKRKKYMRSS